MLAPTPASSAHPGILSRARASRVAFALACPPHTHRSPAATSAHRRTLTSRRRAVLTFSSPALRAGLAISVSFSASSLYLRTALT
eukprot:702159-Prymnesium_polylepis.1